MMDSGGILIWTDFERFQMVLDGFMLGFGPSPSTMCACAQFSRYILSA